MPGEFSRFGAQRALDAVTGRAAPVTYTAYIALCTTAPTDSALGTEYTATGYARQVWTPSVPSAADPPETHNTNTLTFGPFTAGTGATITHVMLMDLSSGGTALADMTCWWALTTSRTPAVNDSLQVAASGGTLTST